MNNYDHKSIEGKWQARWREEGVYEPFDFAQDKPDLEAQQKPFYNLMMFPYPSAEGLHVGNMYAFTGADIYGRYQRMRGNDVFEPIGLDGFGIHSENYALKVGIHPAEQAQISEKRFYKQLERIGNGFAWEERLETYKPEYYRWTQWIFLQLFKHGLAYKKKQSVNWCPSCKTVLADEQVEAGVCERCKSEVTQKELEQWFFRITEYADRLLDNLGKLDWDSRVKIAQQNWIGRSEGAEIRFNVANIQDVESDTTSSHPERSVRRRPILLRRKGSRDSSSQTPQNDSKGDATATTSIAVFTTRPDTIFGATYLVLSPEYENIEELVGQAENKEEVEEYIKKARNKTAQERREEQSKDGIELKGIKAINPASGEEIPIWVAEYVLADYGTGAIMAVPAHDERDWEFAKEHNLSIKQVVAPYMVDDNNPPRDGKKDTTRDMVHCIVRDTKSNKVLSLHWKEHSWRTFITGGVEEGEDVAEAAKREIYEETGYKNVKFIEEFPIKMRADFYAAHKDVNRAVHSRAVLFELESEDRDEVAEEERAKHEAEWIPIEEVAELSPVAELDYILRWLQEGAYAFTGQGELINSAEFSGLPSEEAAKKIVEKVGGEWRATYRLRDWLISRQRYWGPPIPLIFCENCAENIKTKKHNNIKTLSKGEIENPGWFAVPDDDLPVELPYTEEFRPMGTGESPLASADDFVNTTCPNCGGEARRETDVSDTFLDSAWYYIGYLTKQQAAGNRQGSFDLQSREAKSCIEKWTPVDSYIGGAEHAVLHLLYVRFLGLALHDIGVLEFGDSSAPKGEPFPRFRAHGLLIKEGSKMSKSRGNVVNPDEYIEEFGADTLRTYLMFLAPFEQGGDFRDGGILGIVRFLERVWRFYRDDRIEEKIKQEEPGEELQRILHKTIKKVGEDIEELQYNTAISALMVLLGKMEEYREIPTSTKKVFLQLLAPFAPHITEELWQQLRSSSRIKAETDADKRGKKDGFNSIHRSKWPEHDEQLIEQETFMLIIQVDGKLRDKVEVDSDISEDEAKKVALGSERVAQLLHGRETKSIIYVPGKLINIVTG